MQASRHPVTQLPGGVLPATMAVFGPSVASAGAVGKLSCWRADVSMCWLQIAAQSNTFILAGYETTANTLAFSIYNIATHPEVQQRLLQEVDAFGRDRRVTYADLAQVRPQHLTHTTALIYESCVWKVLMMCLLQQ